MKFTMFHNTNNQPQKDLSALDRSVSNGKSHKFLTRQPISDISQAMLLVPHLQFHPNQVPCRLAHVKKIDQRIEA